MVLRFRQYSFRRLKIFKNAKHFNCFNEKNITQSQPGEKKKLISAVLNYHRGFFFFLISRITELVLFSNFTAGIQMTGRKSDRRTREILLFYHLSTYPVEFYESVIRVI